MWKKKKVSLFTTVLLIGIMLLTACTKSNSSNEASPSATAPGSSSSPSQSSASPTGPAVPVKTPFTFTMNTDNPSLNWTSEVALEIQKRTGATIKWDVITGDFREKMNVWLAAGDYPEVINIHDNTLQSYIKAGAVLDLTDLIKQHGPDIMKAYNGDLSILKHTDGKIYGLLQPPTQKVDNLNLKGWLSIQSAVLKDAGYPPIKTLDDVKKIVADYMKKNPKIGGGKTIGFSNYGAANQLFNIFDTSARQYAGLPPLAQFVVDDQKNARYRFFEPHYTDFLKFLNQINKEGLFDPESLIQTPEQFTTKCNQGRVLVIFGTEGCNGGLEQNKMVDRSYVMFDVVAPGVTKLMVKPNTMPNRGGDMWLSITKNAKDAVRIIQFYNEMFKLENQILVGWGIEGKYYTVENGKRVVTDWLVNEYKTKPNTFWEDVGLGYIRQMSANYAEGFTLSDGDYATWQGSPSWIQKNMTTVAVETLGKYGAATQADLMVPATEIDYKFFPSIANWTDEIKNFNTEAIAEWSKVIPKFVLEKDPSKLDGIWAGLEKTLKDKGSDHINQEVTRLYQESLNAAK